MSNKLKNKVAIVTGSTSGIGKAIAILFAAEGAKVAVSGRNLERGREVKQKILDAGGTAIFIPMEARKNETIKSLIDNTITEFGKVDILVNNAGTILIKPFLDITMDDWDFLLETDARSYFYAMQQVIPHMIKNGGGVILNMASLASIKPTINYALYNFVKAGLNLMTKSVALEFAKQKIRANVLCPGTIMTPMIEGSPLNETRLKNIPMGRFGTSEDVAHAALYLCSDESGFVTGASLVIDGGVIQ
ncbi:SDR family oxidoreductase [bacterium]|nr:SDR family oxidoreductase [bacterium]